jgi:hypothetical protein
MRRAGLLPSMGAGGSLVAAGVVVALLGSALLAFDDWPVGAARGADGTATLPAVPVAKVAQASARRAAARSFRGFSAARPRPRAASARPRLRRPTAAGGAVRGSSRSAPRTATPVPAGARRAAPVATPVPASAPVAHAPVTHPQPLPVVTPVPVAVAGPVSQTVRHAVDPVVRALRTPLQAPVQHVRDVAQGAAGTVDGALGAVGIRLP